MSKLDIKTYDFYRASNGEFGAYINDKYVIKFYGWCNDIIVLDNISSLFGFKKTNARIIYNNNNDNWTIIEKMWNIQNKNKPLLLNKVLIMDRLPGIPLCETFSNTGTSGMFDINDPKNPNDAERCKIFNLCYSLGKILVMDLLIRNNDRFNLVKFDDFLLSTTDEKRHGKSWRYWGGNYGNILIDTSTWKATPIDSVFSFATDDDLYCSNIAYLLNSQRSELSFALQQSLRYNWATFAYTSRYICRGIERGVSILHNAINMF